MQPPVASARVVRKREVRWAEACSRSGRAVAPGMPRKRGHVPQKALSRKRAYPEKPYPVKAVCPCYRDRYGRSPSHPPGAAPACTARVKRNPAASFRGDVTVPLRPAARSYRSSSRSSDRVMLREIVIESNWMIPMISSAYRIAKVSDRQIVSTMKSPQPKKRPR